MSISFDSYKSYIFIANEGTSSLIKTSRIVSETVLYTEIWDLIYGDKLLHILYFIKDSSGGFVSCVHWLDAELVWFTEEGHRGKGILKKALSQYIVNDIFGLEELNTIKVRIERVNKASIELAKSINFDFEGYSLRRREYVYKRDRPI